MTEHPSSPAPSQASSAGAGATDAPAVWVPRQVRGYSADELRAIAPDELRRLAVSKQELETPALCVDLDALERNIATMQARVTCNGIGVRPHAKSHKCAAIARLQLDAGAVGICTAKLSEAEALFAQGIDRICMTTSNPAVSKTRRAMALRKRNPQFIQAVDEEQNARDLSDAAIEAGIVADVVIDVAVGTRSGIPPGDGAIALAALVDRLPGLTLRGVLAYDGKAQHIVGFQARKAHALQQMEASARTCERMRAAGLSTEIFSGGGTGTYNVQHLVPGFTDVQAGSYVFIDMQYLAIGSEDGNTTFTDFEPSLTVVTTVLNNRFPDLLTTDAGAKAIGIDEPHAGVIGEPGMDYDAGSDEFGVIACRARAREYRIGDRLELIVPHCDPAVNLYDHVYGMRGDRLEVVWPITARGKSQ